MSGAPPHDRSSENATTRVAVSAGDPTSDATDRTETGASTASLADPVDTGAEGPARGTPIDHFVVKRCLGEGGMGRVYLARDSVLGRPVALKIIRPDRVAPEQVQEFLREARLTAQFIHPHIVVLHAVGQYEGQPYLALEYLDGESLRERIAKRTLTAPEAMRVGLGVANALAEAHRRGITHRDLKPANIVIPTDGRARVLDFGVAGLCSPVGPGGSTPPPMGSPETRQHGIKGTPAYMAPEQWRGAPPGSPMDVWGLGVVLYESIEGRRPFVPREGMGLLRWSHVFDPDVQPNPMQADVPTSLRDLISACLQKQPDQRPTAQQAVGQLEVMLAGVRTGVAAPEGPFRGLEPFDERHASVFHGRDDDISAFVERLRTLPVLPVVGRSGAGKTSFVQAGVVPRLREQGAWVVIRFRPGNAPFVNLARHLLSAPSTTGLGGAPSDEMLMRPADGDIDALVADLEAAPGRLNLRLNNLARDLNMRVLLLVDQLEELYTHVDDAAARCRFAAMIAAGADDPADPVRVAFTVRDDFLGRLAECQPMQRVLGQVTVLRSPGEEALREILLAPVAGMGHAYDDPALVDEMIDQVQGAAACLPLLQFAGQMLWQRRDPDRRLLRRADFTQMGGVAGALATHADGVLDGLSPRLLDIARTLLIRLVSPEGTRRLLGREEVLDGLAPEAPEILARLTASRLVTARRDRNDPDADSVIELAHESLVSNWAQLAHWIDETREERALLGELEQVAALWHRRGRRVEETWYGDALRDTRRRLERVSAPVPETVAAFIQASRRADRRRWIRRGLTVGGVAAMLIGVLLVGQRMLATIDDTVEDIGRFELHLRPFDWDPKTLTARPVAPSELPALAWNLYAPNGSRSGEPLAVRRTPVAPLTDGPPGRREWVETRGGAAVLEIVGRGRSGQRCAPSRIDLRRLPGARARERSPGLQIHVGFPTCQATYAGTVDIPAGPFVRGGRSDPPSSFPDYVDPERKIDLPEFGIDRTEVTNAAYRPFAEMASQTGRAAPVYPNVDDPLYAHAGDPDRPVSNVDVHAAEAFCRFMGKRLPSSNEWEKAARGGLYLDAHQREPNPHPRRNFPWGTAALTSLANLDGPGDGYEGVAPVGQFPHGASPYGVLDMAGNVYEWTGSPRSTTSAATRRLIRGGNWGSPPELEHHSISYQNWREPAYHDHGIGFRCAIDGP